MLADNPIPTPPFTTRAPVEADVEAVVWLCKVIGLFRVKVPVAAPKEIAVPACKALTVVAVVLKTLNDALSVTTLVVNVGDVEKTNFPAVPVSSDTNVANWADVVEANTLKSLPVVVSVPAVGNVTLDAAVVVKVKLFAPEVASVELFAKVKVAADAGAVNVSLLYVVAETFPFAKITPEIDEDDPEPVNKLPPIPTPPVTTNAPDAGDIDTWLLVMLVVPPINAFPVTPIPPKTVNAPDVVDMELVNAVTARPDKVTKPVDGLTTKDVTVDKPSPVPEEVFTVVMKNDALDVDAVAATDVADDAGTACQDGTDPVPVDVNT